MNIVRERAVVREMIGVANEIAEAGYDPQGRTSADLLDFAELYSVRTIQAAAGYYFDFGHDVLKNNFRKLNICYF